MHSPFWDQYSTFIQPPIKTTVPFTWSTELLDMLQDGDIKVGATEQKTRLNSLFPDLSNRRFHRITSDYTDLEAHAIPTPFEWAFSMVRSRCFEFIPGWFAVVPLIEMANHKKLPNAKYVLCDYKVINRTIFYLSLF